MAFRSRRWVWTFVVYFALSNMLWGAWSALGPIVAERDLGSMIATRVKPPRPLVFVALAEALFAMPLAFLAAGAPVALLACGALLSGAGMMLGMSVWESTLQRHIPAESLSRVSSYDWFGSMAFYPLGLAVWGPVAAVIGISLSLWLAFGLFIAAIVTLLAVPDIRRLPAKPRPVSTASA